jgi:hypothetical protein
MMRPPEEGLERDEEDEAASAAAAEAEAPTRCASSFLRASSTCCTVSDDCASRDVVRALYLVPWSRTEMRISLSASSSEYVGVDAIGEARGAEGGRVDCKKRRASRARAMKVGIDSEASCLTARNACRALCLVAKLEAP